MANSLCNKKTRCKHVRDSNQWVLLICSTMSTSVSLLCSLCWGGQGRTRTNRRKILTKDNTNCPGRFSAPSTKKDESLTGRHDLSIRVSNRDILSLSIQSRMLETRAAKSICATSLLHSFYQLYYNLLLLSSKHVCKTMPIVGQRLVKRFTKFDSNDSFKISSQI